MLRLMNKGSDLSQVSKVKLHDVLLSIWRAYICIVYITMLSISYIHYTQRWLLTVSDFEQFSPSIDDVHQIELL